MSEPVTVTGTPRIAVDVDGQSGRFATFSSGSGTSTLTFTYAPSAGDLDLDGITLTSPIDLNGGTLKDLQGNNASLNFTVPNTSNIKVNYPSLSMDFTNGSSGRYTLGANAYTNFTTFLGDAGGTFTRSGTATYFDSNGYLQTASANTPRFDYDPTGPTPKGLLIEPGSTNLSMDSSDITTANWSIENVTRTPNIITAPDNTMSADKVSDNTANLRHILIPSNANITSGTVYTASVFVKPAEQNYFQFVFGNAAFGNDAYVNFNLSGAGSITFSGIAILNSSIQSVGNGWYRCTITASAITTASNFHGFIALLNNTNNTTRTPAYIGSGGGIYVWGMQLEANPTASSYIPTGNATVSRGADNLIFSAGSWLSSTQGTLFSIYDSSLYSMAGNDVAAAMTLDDGTGNNAMTIRVTGNPTLGKNAYARVANVMNPYMAIGGNYTSPGSATKQALAYAVNDSAFSAEGAITTSANPSSIPSFSFLRIGTDRASGFGFLMGHVQKARYYPRRVSNSQLQLLTP